jgi:Uma2 family endonuclease
MNTSFPVRLDGRLSVKDYLAFIDTRPDDGRWQLIDGVAMLMPQPTLRHQRIASNLCHVLTDHYRARRLALLPIFRIGLIVRGAELFRPFGDVVVADDSAGEIDTAFVDRFYLVAEVLSDGDVEKDIPASAATTSGIRTTSIFCGSSKSGAAWRCGRGLRDGSPSF